jgi:F-type H+-transporting ATPase subunit b
MLIDWFTVASQALNFIVLVWLMKRFLYKPILNSIDQREKKISDTVNNAKTEKDYANKLKNEFEQKNEDIEKNRDNLLKKAKEEVANEREELIKEVRTDATALRKKWQKTLLSEQQNASEEIQRRVHDEIFSIARKTLRDLADSNLEERITEVLIKKLGQLNENETVKFQKALKENPSALIVRSSFELPIAQRNALQKAIKDLFKVDTSLKYGTSPNLISGIELMVNGSRIAWSISDYLESLKISVGEILQSPPAENS